MLQHLHHAVHGKPAPSNTSLSWSCTQHQQLRQWSVRDTVQHWLQVSGAVLLPWAWPFSRSSGFPEQQFDIKLRHMWLLAHFIHHEPVCIHLPGCSNSSMTTNPVQLFTSHWSLWFFWGGAIDWRFTCIHCVLCNLLLSSPLSRVERALAYNLMTFLICCIML